MGLCLKKYKYTLEPINTRNLHNSTISYSSSNSLSPIKLLPLIQPISKSIEYKHNINMNYISRCKNNERIQRIIRQKYEENIREIYKAELAKQKNILQ